jgi:hypothetical protein
LFIRNTNVPRSGSFVLNEAEVTLLEFLRDLNGGARRVYCRELPRPPATPAPMWELADRQRYASMSIQFSRGCPFDCEFCNITSMFGHRPRQDGGQVKPGWTVSTGLAGGAVSLWTTISSAQTCAQEELLA